MRSNARPAIAPIEVEAAGGIVARRGAEGWEIVVVHRRRYDDWSLPKGKIDAGESAEWAAEREVGEETGLRCRRLQELEPVFYRDARGRGKRVRYWLMAAVSGRIEDRAPDREIDGVRWVGLDEAARLLDYARDREIVAGLSLT